MTPDQSDIRFGCFLPIPAAPVDKLLKIAKINEEAGFDSIWAPDHLLFIPPGVVPEAWSMLAAAAIVTEKATLGTCVSDPHRHHPAVLAQKVATVDQISGGRVTLGLGAGEAMNLEPYGIDWKRPVSRLIEFTTIVRKFWSGETFNYEGEFWKLRDAFLQIRPSRGTIPIYFGANSPRMLEVTGEIADGWLSTPLSPTLFNKRLSLVKKGAEKANRPLNEIDVGAYLYTSVTEKSEDASKQIEKMKAQVIPSPQLLKEAGYHVELSEELQSISYFKALLNSEWLEKFLTFAESIPLNAAIEFSITGTTEDCIEKIEAYIKAGVKHFLLLNAGPDPRSVVKVYREEIIPYFKKS